MIEFKNVSKQYDSKLALDNLNLTINDGEIFGLIGHNGAGKSTAIKALTSIIEVSNGDILFDNMNLRENRLECKKQIGYVPDSPDIFLTLSPYEYWSLIANLYELDEKTTKERIYEYSKLFNMIGVEHQEINSFSHGMRQKVFLIAALLYNPRFWIMDEPMTGLDPQAAFDLKNLMKEHTKQGHSVLFSTHVLEVAEHLCDRIGILSHGKLIFVGTLDELRAQHEGNSLEEIYLNLIKSSNRYNLGGV